MSNKQLLSKSIHQRFLAVALLPLLLIITLLTLLTIESRRTDLIENLVQSGESSSNYLATISDFSLYSRNQKLLQEIASSVLQIPNVADVAFLDSNSEPVLTAGHLSQGYSDEPQEEHQDAESSLLEQILPGINHLGPMKTDQYLYFKKPVFLSGIDVSDYQEESPTEMAGPELVGWVLLAIDRTAMLDKQKTILTTSALLFLFGLIIAVVVTYYLSLALIAPIQQLTATIRQMASGNLHARAETGTDDELAVLAAGINQLAASVAEGKETLEHRIRFATRQLQETLDHLQIKNRELEISREKAEAANQAKSGFLARMSHELRTPITSIQGFIRLLDTTRLAENERHYCQIIDQAALQLLTLIDDILAFSKLQSDTVELAEQPLDLAECVEQVIAMFTPQAQHKGLNLVVDYAPELSLNRVGDSIRIQQILSNLIANAIKFSDEGGVYISLKSNDDRDVIIDVRDTGIGIPEAAQAQLFNAFAQADTSISRRYGGTGLGLSIVKSLVDLMGGDICLQSGEGKGTTFSILLPLMCSTQTDDWQLPSQRVVIFQTDSLTDQSLQHAMTRFGINDVTFASLENLVEASASLKKDDAVIICASALQTTENNPADIILKLREGTPAKLILLAAQFNFYQQFNARERIELHPVSFLAMPPPLSELHRALDTVSSASSAVNSTMDTEHVLDGIKILIAEDNQFTRLLLDTLLSRFGAYCTLTSNGKEALAACQQDRFDLLLVDLHMPQKNGIETLKTLRNSNNLNANIPALALTADILQQEEQSLFKAGANGLLLKPLDENELLTHICELLNLQVLKTLPEPPAAVDADLSTELFKQEVKSLLMQSRDYLQQDDIEALRESVHQLLGIAGVFQLKELEARVRELHTAIKNHCLDQVPDLLNALDEESQCIDL